jgi:hypothetical protein
MQSVQCTCLCKLHFVNITEETHPAGVKQDGFICGDCSVACQSKKVIADKVAEKISDKKTASKKLEG